MAYNANIPQPGDQLKNSQPQILANFQEINTALAVNHVGFNVADQGKHKFIQMPQQGANPTTAATEYAMFTKAGLFSGSTETLLRKPNNGTTVNITEKRLSATDGWYQLPSGIIVKYQKVDIPLAASTPGIDFNFLWSTVDTIAFTSAPFNYSIIFLSSGSVNIRLIPYVDTVQSTNLACYVRLCPAVLPTVNLPAFSVIVTAYGI